MASLYMKGPSWYLSWYNAKHKKKYKCVGKVKRYAELALKDLEVRLARDQAGFPETKKTEVTLEDRLNRHLDKVRANSAPRTVARYKAIAAHLLNYFSVNGAVTSEALEKYKEHRLGEGAKTQTINLELQFLKSVWADAEGHHPFRAVKPLKVKDSKEIRFLSKEEAQKLLAAADDEYRDYLIGYLYTGARKDELLAVTWEDLQNGHLRITNIKTQRGYKDKYRWVPVHADSKLAEVLARRKAAGSPTPFPNQWGPNTLRVKLIALAKKAGIPKLTRLHDLRHTFASHLVQKGISLYVVSKLLGHSSQETTTIYAHLSPETYEAAVGMLEF
jgi:integrase